MLFSLSILVYLIYLIDLDKILNSLLHANIIVLLIPISLSFISSLFRSERWKIILNRKGVEISHLTSLKLTFIGTFYGLVTPAKLGEVLKTRYLDDRVKGLLSTIVDKLYDILILFVLCMVGGFIFANIIENVMLTIFLVGGIILLITILLSHPRIFTYLLNIISPKKEKIEGYNILKEFISSNVLVCVVLTIFIYAANLMQGYLVLYSLNASTDIFPTIFLFPLIMLSTLIPITFSGMGIREGTSILLLSVAGISDTVAFSFSILWWVIGIVVPALVGVLFTLTEEFKIHKHR